MTSASLSLSNRISNHKKYITRTLWSSMLGFVLMAIYYVLGTAFMVARSINYGRVFHQSPERIKMEKINAAFRVLGMEQLGWILVVLIAIAFAFQGFSYVFESNKIDFYLSQPTTRGQRIKKNYFNAITTFILMYLSVNIVALLLAAILGAVNGAVIVAVLYETVKAIVLFFAIYNITVLAIMLSGTPLISMLVLAFFMAVTTAFGYELKALKNIFFATYANRDTYGIIGSPLFDRVTVLRLVNDLKLNSTNIACFDTLNKWIDMTVDYEIDILITGMIAFALVILVSRFRKAEHAGKTICYRPFRWLVKVISCVLLGIGCGVVFYEMNYYMWYSSRFVTIMFAVMLMAVIITGCVIEVLFDGNIRSVFKGMAQNVMALAIVSLIFIVFRGDLIGYDSYIPSASKVESCALLREDYDFRLYDGHSDMYYASLAEDYMELTDIETFNKLVQAGLKTQKEWVKFDREGNYQDLGWNNTVLYRLKNGKMVYREICIPYDIDENLLSSIIDSKEYIRGSAPVFHDDKVREFDELNRKTGKIQYNAPGRVMTTTEMTYAELSDAYCKDLENSFSYKLVSTQVPIGRVDYINSVYDGYCNCGFNVYKTYTNTIELLKKYGVFVDDSIDIDSIDSIEVTNYYPGYNMEDEDFDINSINVESKSFVYTENDKIRDIIEKVICNDYYCSWYKRNLNEQFVVIVNFKNNKKDMMNAQQSYFSFEMGKVPDYIYADTN